MSKQVKSTSESTKGNVSTPVKPNIIMPKKRMVMAFVAICGLVAMLLFPKATAAKTAMLYIMGDNGKKSGRASGNVYSRNGRIRGMAFFARTLNQFTSAAKAVFSFFNSNYKALTEDQRKTWVGYVKFVSNRFAESVKVAGKTAYTQLNANIANSGGTAIDVAPSDLASAPVYVNLTGVTSSAAAGTVSIAYVLEPTATNAFIYATKPLSPGIEKPSKSAFRLVSLGDFSAASPLAFGADYVNRFGLITSKAGSKIFIRVVNVDNTTGLTSIANQIDSVIGA